MCNCTLSLTSALDEGGWSTPRRGRFTPVEQEAGWASEPVWTGAENLDPTGIRSPDRPARSESLYRLSCMLLTLILCSDDAFVTLR